jgi:hypothetical protein
MEDRLFIFQLKKNSINLELLDILQRTDFLPLKEDWKGILK